MKISTSDTSSNDGNAAFSLIVEAEHAKWYASLIDTQLGPMIAVADQEALYSLGFVDCSGLEYAMEQLKQETKRVIVLGRTKIIDLIEKEIHQYFDGKLQTFTTPLKFFGSPFQQLVWHELQKIPYGTTRSYAQLAIAIAKPLACRAVAQANGANQFAIVIPCHRVINGNGDIGGYNGGVNRKIWLLNHEKR